MKKYAPAPKVVIAPEAKPALRDLARTYQEAWTKGTMEVIPDNEVESTLQAIIEPLQKKSYAVRAKPSF